MTRLTLCSMFLITLAGALPSITAEARETTRIVVPLPPGSTADLVIRTVAGNMAKLLDKNIVIENKAGALMVTGTKDIVSAKPDGNTIGVCFDGSSATIPAAYRVLADKSGKQPPYNPLDLTPIGLIGDFSIVLVVTPGIGIDTLPEFIRHMRDNPGKMSIAFGHPTGKLALALLKSAQRVSFEEVGYAGESNAYSDLISGRVQAIFSTVYTAQSHVESGALRALGVLGEKRSDLLPGIKTLAEQGLPGFGSSVVSATWGALCGPPNMKPGVVAAYNGALKTALQDPAVVEKLRTVGWTAHYSTSEELGQKIREQNKQMEDFLRKTGVTIVGE